MKAPGGSQTLGCAHNISRALCMYHISSRAQETPLFFPPYELYQQDNEKQLCFRTLTFFFLSEHLQTSLFLASALIFSHTALSTAQRQGLEWNFSHVGTFYPSHSETGQWHQTCVWRDIIVLLYPAHTTLFFPWLAAHPKKPSYQFLTSHHTAEALHHIQAQGCYFLTSASSFPYAFLLLLSISPPSNH